MSCVEPKWVLEMLMFVPRQHQITYVTLAPNWIHWFWWHAYETSPNHIMSILMARIWDITKPHYITFDSMHMRHQQTAFYQFWWHAYKISPNHIISVLVARIETSIHISILMACVWDITKPHYIHFSGGIKTLPNHILSILMACVWDITKPRYVRFSGTHMRHHHTTYINFGGLHMVYGCWQLVSTFVWIMQFCVVVIVTYRLVYFITHFHCT
jgi:hypothetical protein